MRVHPHTYFGLEPSYKTLINFLLPAVENVSHLLHSAYDL